MYTIVHIVLGSEEGPLDAERVCRSTGRGMGLSLGFPGFGAVGSGILEKGKMVGALGALSAPETPPTGAAFDSEVAIFT